MKNEFQSLRVGYEAIKDSLKNQREVIQNYINRAITLFSIATAVIGIGLPSLYAQNITKLYLINPWFPLTYLSIIPVMVYGVNVYLFYCVLKKDLIITMDNPTIIKKEFVSLEENHFYLDMIQYTEDAFKKNEIVVKRKADNLQTLVGFVITETAIIIALVIAFSALS